jgi:ADP-ribose pyrophosphatase YjhB (NUDIX family)
MNPDYHHSRPGDEQYFCSRCAERIELIIPAGDSRLRTVCPTCRTIHYRNPVIVAGAIPVWEDRVLLCKRGIEPRYGKWTLPAGFMELKESTEQAAVRETLEESGAAVTLEGAFSIISIPYVDQVHLFYRARMQNLDFGPREESLAVELFREDQIPWEDLSFRTVITTLELYFADRRRGSFGFHSQALALPSKS